MFSTLPLGHFHQIPYLSLPTPYHSGQITMQQMLLLLSTWDVSLWLEIKVSWRMFERKERKCFECCWMQGTALSRIDSNGNWVIGKRRAKRSESRTVSGKPRYRLIIHECLIELDRNGCLVEGEWIPCAVNRILSRRSRGLILWAKEWTSLHDNLRE